jgi:porphobilinogen deaminase
MPRPARKLTTVLPRDTKPRTGSGLPMSTLTSAVSRDERTMLATLRRKIAEQIDEGCRAPVLAALTKHLLTIDGQIRALDARSAGQLSEDDDDDDGAAAFDPTSV